MQLLRDNKLYAKLKKSEFFQEKGKFLGHVIGKDGIQVDPDKISAVKIGQLYKMCSNKVISRVGKPYEKLHQRLFLMAASQIKEALCNAPVLAFADDKEPFELIYDACGFGIGAVLMQNENPVAFYSYKSNFAERLLKADSSDRP